MFAYLLRRIAIIIPTLVFVSMIIFGLQLLLPGDPAPQASREYRSAPFQKDPISGSRGEERQITR